MLKKLIIIGLAIWAYNAHGQTTCSVNTPCTTIGWNGPSATATTPVMATIYKCVGNATNCSLAALNAFIASPTTPSVWSVAGKLTQSTANASYTDPVSYGQLLNYSIGQVYVGGALAAAPSPLVVVAIPTAPSVAPSSAMGVTVVLKTQ